MNALVRLPARYRWLQLALLQLPILALWSCGGSEPDANPEPSGFRETLSSLEACKTLLARGPLRVADDRADRFTGKVSEEAAECRGGPRAVAGVRENVPWLDWRLYWGTADAASRNANYDEGWSQRLAGR